MPTSASDIFAQARREVGVRPLGWRGLGRAALRTSGASVDNGKNRWNSVDNNRFLWASGARTEKSLARLRSAGHHFRTSDCRATGETIAAKTDRRRAIVAVTEKPTELRRHYP
jgi:hypothetical protein